MLKSKNLFILFGLFVLLALNPVYAQITLINTLDSRIVVKGTSTLHDWSMESRTFDCAVSLGQVLENKAVVEKISFTLQVESLKSDKSGLDKNAYKALKTKEIQFQSTALDSMQISPEQVKGTIIGDLTIAGTTKPISFPFVGTINDGKELETEVSYKINMKDFDIKSPSFMFGTFKTGTEVEVIIHMKLQPEKQS